MDESIDKIIEAHLSRRLTQKKARSTLTAQSAEEFIPYFEMALEKGEDVCVKYKQHFTYSVLTLKRKISDALLYLCRNAEPEERRLQFLNLRRQVVISESLDIDEGIWIRFKGGEIQSKTLKRLGKPDFGSNLEWKSALSAYLEDGARAPFNLTGLTLLAEDVQWALNLLNTVNETRESKLVFIVNLNVIRIIP